MKNNVLVYGGAAIVVGLGTVYLMSKRQASAAAPDTQQLGTVGAIPNTMNFGADFTGNSVGDFGLGEPVQNWGPGAVTTLPPPYVEPAPVSVTKRKRCGCCPDDTMQPASQITANLAPLLNEMYQSAGVAEWNA
jgi:hypothetical protein